MQRWWRRRIGVSNNEAYEIGEAGERAAEAFLHEKCGYSVVARNWRNPSDRRDEIDLVCRDREVLVFVEVKTRVAGSLVGGYDAVNRRKRAALRRAVRAYIRRLPAARTHVVRFDVVEVERALSGASEVRHFENVKLFPGGLAL